MADMLSGLLPKGLLNDLMLYNMGRLISLDPRLRTREVPSITVQEFIDAVKEDER